MKMSRRTLVIFHRWIGLVAGAWLLTLGVTGVFLDHDEWRWLRQTEVPENWLSPSMMRYLPATVMRYVVSDPADENSWIGGSERGLWITRNRGATWEALRFPNEQHPQVLRFAKIDVDDQRLVIIATDDGLWVMTEFGASIKRLALDGHFINMISPGAKPHSIIGVDDFSTVFTLDINHPENIQHLNFEQPQISGLPETLTLYRFLFDLHFGYGLLSRKWSTWINDLGGIALSVLALTGFLAWYLKRKWRRAGISIRSDHRQSILSGLYRSHAPVIGILGVVPILYLSVTGILFNHILTFIEWGEAREVRREHLPAVWQYQSLKGEIDQVVTFAGDPDHLLISTRFGVLRTRDGGASWSAQTELGSERGQLFRSSDHVFYSTNSRQFFVKGDSEADWETMAGLPSIVYDAEFTKNGLFVKNSRGFFKDSGQFTFEADALKHPDLEAATLYLFLIEIHTGNVFHPEFRWVSDALTVMGILMIVTGPILWWRRKW
jgi:hypothetical protein